MTSSRSPDGLQADTQLQHSAQRQTGENICTQTQAKPAAASADQDPTRSRHQLLHLTPTMQYANFKRGALLLPPLRARLAAAAGLPVPPRARLAAAAQICTRGRAGPSHVKKLPLGKVNPGGVMRPGLHSFGRPYGEALAAIGLAPRRSHRIQLAPLLPFAPRRRAASHHVHPQYLLAGLAHPAPDGRQAQPLVRLESVAAAEAVVHAVDQQHVDRFLQPYLLDRLHECLDLILVIGAGPAQRPPNQRYGNILNPGIRFCSRRCVK